MRQPLILYAIAVLYARVLQGHGNQAPLHPDRNIGQMRRTFADRGRQRFHHTE
jgi:hypothetical protein